MRVRVIAFGILKDWLGTAPSTVELREGSSVADLLAGLGKRVPVNALTGIAVSVNAEYATARHALREGDEVGLLPPVSGGVADAGDASGTGEPVTVWLDVAKIDADKLVTEAKRGEDGAVVVFDGIVRNHSRGRETWYLDYEAYTEMALKQMHALAVEARAKFGVRQVTIAHRLGRLEVGETSVLIVVTSAHRAQAFEACRWVIDTLKQTVPIWKKETFADGAVWAAGEPFPAAISVDGGGLQ